MINTNQTSQIEINLKEYIKELIDEMKSDIIKVIDNKYNIIKDE